MGKMVMSCEEKFKVWVVRQEEETQLSAQKKS